MGFSRHEYWSGVPLPSPCPCIKATHLNDTEGKSQKSAQGLMIRAQYCWPRGFSCLAEVKSKSMCLGSERICPESHPRISRNQVESPNFTCSWPSLSLQWLSYRLVTHFCLEMIVIKFHLAISSINHSGQTRHLNAKE